VGYNKFYNYISPRIVSKIIEMIQNNELEKIELEKPNNFDSYYDAYSEFRLDVKNKNYSIRIHKEKTKKVQKLIINELEKIDEASENPKLNTNCLIETLLLDTALIEKLNTEHPINSLIEQNCEIWNVNKLFDFLKDIDFKCFDEALLIYNKQKKQKNKEIVFTIKNLFNVLDKIKYGNYRISDECFEYSFAKQNENYQMAYIIKYNQAYFFEKDKNTIKIFKEEDPYSQRNAGFSYFGLHKDKIKQQKALISNKKYFKSKTPIFEINSKKTINNDLVFFENLIAFILHLYTKNQIEIPLPFDKEKLEDIVQHIKYLDLNNMYVDFLWNTEANVKWKKGASGYFLSIDPLLFNFDKLAKPVKLIKNEHTASVSSFNKNSNIMNLPKNISPEWIDFVKKSYEYVLKNHRNFKFSNLKDSDFEKVAEILNKAFE